MSEPSTASVVPSLAELAAVTRSGLVESRHFGSLVAVDPSGAPLLELGTPDAVVLPRSTVKPLQALACLTAGASLAGPELAIAAGSHTGEDEHVRVVRSILERAGLDESALGCPVDRPEDEGTFERLVRAGQPRARIRMNCSGKHAAMLLASAVNGWSTHDYLDTDHPLQQHVRATVAELTGIPVAHDAIDGCGAPLFGTTVRGIAQAFRAMVQADPTTPAGRVAAAMREHPFYVGGSGHQNSVLMETVPGALAKGGAEGVIGVAAADGTAVSMKIVDGSPRATTVLALRVLERFGVDVSGAAAVSSVAILGGGVRVGEILVGRDLADALGGRRVTAVEVCLDDLDGITIAENSGADRIELCAALSDGGITPSIGTIGVALHLATRIGINVLVRQRPGDFVFSANEVDAMVEDIHAIRVLPNPAAVTVGFVIGALHADGTIDVEATRRMLDACAGTPVTFHKAFDQTPDLAAALDDLIGLGVTRILTSGGHPTALGGAPTLTELVDRARGRVIILAGGGVRPANVAELVRLTGVNEVHLRAGALVPSAACETGGAASAYDSGFRMVTSGAIIRELLRQLGRKVGVAA